MNEKIVGYAMLFVVFGGIFTVLGILVSWLVAFAIYVSAFLLAAILIAATDLVQGY